MTKLDLKQQHPDLYAPRAGAPRSVQVPAFAYLMVDGRGDPNTAPEYREAVEALFACSYALKFRIKKSPQGLDYAVMPLEGLWWSDDLSSFTSGDRSAWQWTMMIVQPDGVTAALVDETCDELRRKKPLPALDRLRLETWEEGRCAQVLHVGPFTTEGATLDALHAWIAASGAALRGKHHEIYLSDIRKADPARWKTLLRQPMS